MLNDNLEAQTQAFFDSLFITDAEPDCTLADIALVNPTRALAKNTEAKCFDMSTLPTKGCIPEGEIIKPYNGGARFINGDNTMHISKGELVKISFEVRNVSGESVYGLVPTVKETTGNKHLLISPATMIENLGSHKAIRYTAYISAERSLKKGTAHFQIVIMSADKQLSNVVEFDVELN